MRVVVAFGLGVVIGVAGLLVLQHPRTHKHPGRDVSEASEFTTRYQPAVPAIVPGGPDNSVSITPKPPLRVGGQLLIKSNAAVNRNDRESCDATEQKAPDGAGALNFIQN
jgi:hypothetical protein